MTSYSAWQQFRQGFAEVSYLIKSATKLPTFPKAGSHLSEQQILLRAATVLLSSHVETFFVALAEEVADTLGDDWNSLSFGMQRYVILQTRAHLQDELAKEKYDTCGDPKDVNSLYDTCQEVNSWLSRPKILAKSQHRRKLENFYRESAPKAINRMLRQLRHDGKLFFTWIEERGFDRSRFWTVLDQMVILRTSIVHRGISFYPTLADARLYLAVTTVLIRQACRFAQNYP